MKEKAGRYRIKSYVNMINFNSTQCMNLDNFLLKNGILKASSFKR